MKKLALTLAALATVSAVASAKEVVAAPVVAVEPVTIVCPEPAAPAWRPTGYIDFQAKYYGEEDRNFRTSAFGEKTKLAFKDQTRGEYARTQLMGAINLTEASRFEFRIRNYANFRNEDYAYGNASTSQNNSRFRYFYNHGNMGDTKINFTSRFEYFNNPTGLGNSHNLGYQARMNFAKYFDFMPTWANVTNFTVAPNYEHQVLGDNDSQYSNRLGVDLYTWTELPFGFALEMNVYGDFDWYGRDAYLRDEDGKKTIEDQGTLGFEAYLYRNFELWKAEKNKLEFTTEFGYETYNAYKGNKTYSQDWYDSVGDGIGDSYNLVGASKSYQAYALLGLQATHQHSDTLKFYAWAGGEYRNWAITKTSEASHWSWQPQVTLGFRSAF